MEIATSNTQTYSTTITTKVIPAIFSSKPPSSFFLCVISEPNIKPIFLSKKASNATCYFF